MRTDQSSFRTVSSLVLLAFLVVSCSNEQTDSTSTETTTDSSVEAQVSRLLPHQQMAKDILRELIEIDTTHSTGSTTIAAEAMAAHLIAEGFAADGSVDWYALGPVAIEPELQSQKIGARLIEAGLNMLRERDAAGCVLVGNPAYYSRFGFQLFPDLCPEGEPAAFYQILPLRVEKPKQVVGFHPLFHA